MSVFELLPAKIALEIIELVAKALRGLRITFDAANVSLHIDYARPQTIDERIAKIEQTKVMLQDALQAIEELRQTATINKRDAELAMRQLSQLEHNKKNLEQELENIHGLIEADVDTFRKVAGIPSPAQVRRERLLGFVSGVIASAVASGIVAIIALVVKAISRAH